MKLRNVFLVATSIGLGLSSIGCGSSGGGGGTAGGGNATSTGGGGGTTASGGTTSTGGTTATGGSTSTGGTGSGPCTPGAQQCSGNVPQTCDANGTWQSGTACQFVCSAGACTGTCTPGAKQCNGQTPQTCDASGSWQDGTACQYVCDKGDCAGSCTPGEVKCKLDTPQTCGADGKWATSGTACPYGCDQGKCKDACQAGEFHCEGNAVQQCDLGPPPKWVDTGTVCNAASGQKCNAATGTCVGSTVVGSSTPTGTYYQYATFNTSTAFLGGYDVDSYEDYIYVNRSGTYLDVYKVTIADSDGDGKIEPDQHPSNPLNTGPIEQRTLTLVKSYTKSADGAPLGGASIAEVFALSDRIYTVGPAHNGTVSEYKFGQTTSTIVVQPATTAIYCSQMGFGDNDGIWYCSNEGARRVYSFHKPSNSWVVEFDYPNLAGSHMDGMEVIVSPKTGEQYVYVSDMTSDFIGQYRKDPTGWTQVNLFQYTDGTGSSVEGFGFGAFNHFWATGGTYLYELGGGDLAQYLE
jgi:hypothetical protein